MTCPVCASFGSGGCDCGDLVPPTVHDLARVKRRGIFTVNDEPHPDDMPTHEVRRTVITETRPIGATEWTEHSRKTEVLP